MVLDLSAGTYDVIDGVGSMMWRHLLRDPAERDIPGLADTCGAPISVIDADLADFAEAQQQAGRLQPEPLRPAPSAAPSPRYRPTVWRALRGRAAAERDLRRSFASAYTRCTAPAADTAPPRVPVDRLVQKFRTADGVFPSREAPLDCLPRSLALTRFLRTAGWPVAHVIGVALNPFEAHAWVELDGTPLDETASALLRYTKIAEA